MSRNRNRVYPRISANGLSEYLSAPAARRRRIIQQQKTPKDFQVAYYREAGEAISRFIAGGCAEPNILLSAMNDLRLDVNEAATEWEIKRRNSCQEAIATFRQMYKELPLQGKDVHKGANNQRRLHVQGVSVSVRPDVLILENSKGKIRKGGVKLYFSKSQTLLEDRAKYIGALLHYYFDEYGGQGGFADYRLCVVLDVFSKKYFVAPRTFKRRRQDIEAGCEEISRLWPFV